MSQRKNSDYDGLDVGVRIVEADSETAVEGIIVSIDDEAETAWVKWDNGHDAFDCPLKELVPVDGW